MQNTENLIAKINTLSPLHVAEVEDFVEFLSAKARKQAAIQRLLSVAPALELSGVPPMAEDALASELNAVRNARRAQGNGR
jgi:hypothetical protein